jgi:hypothetical protein
MLGAATDRERFGRTAPIGRGSDSFGFRALIPARSLTVEDFDGDGTFQHPLDFA